MLNLKEYLIVFIGIAIILGIFPCLSLFANLWEFITKRRQNGRN